MVYATYHPDNTSHAGTAVIIRSNLKHNLLPEYRTPHIQATSIAVYDKQGALAISSIYCPPKHKITATKFNNFFGTLGGRYIVGGDWNAKNTFWGSRLTVTRGRELKKSLDHIGLRVLTTCQPTYWPTDPNKLPDLLDFFIYKGLQSYYYKIESNFDSTSDHTSVITTMSITVIERSKKPYLYNNKTDWPGFKEYLHDHVDLKLPLKSEDDIDCATEYITSLIQQAAWLSTPDCEGPDSRNVSNKNNLPLEAREMILEKRRLRRKWHSSRHPEDKKALNKAAAELKKFLAEAENDTLQRRLELLNATSNNEHSLWKTVKSSQKPQLIEYPLKRPDGMWAKTDEERAEAFGAFLKNVFTPNTDTADNAFEEEVKSFLQSDLQLSPPIKSCTPRELKGIIRELQLKKAPGYDLITAEVLQQLPTKVLVFLTTLFNSMLRIGYFPNQWKVSQITMILKAGKPPHQTSSYRPISLLPLLSKLFEKVISRRLNRWLEDNRIIPQHQFGFRMKHSTIEQVHRVCDHIRHTLESKEYCSGVFLDVQQAFDKNQQIFYITATFADDTAILASDKDPVSASKTVQSHLDQVHNWMKRCKIKASAAKSNLITFTLRRDNCPPVKLGGEVLPHQTVVKYLGFHLDRKQIWKTHIQKKRDELNQKYRSLSWLLGRQSKLSVNNKLLIYKAVLKPVWTYGIQLWGSAKTSNIAIMQRFQNSVLKTIAHAPWFTKIDEVHEYLQMPTVKAEVENLSRAYRDRIADHPNKLATDLTSCIPIRRIIFHFHNTESNNSPAKVAPPRLQGERKGVFSTRSPHRPCRIGLSLVKIQSLEGNRINFLGVDMINGTPVLDIKPYIPQYDYPSPLSSQLSQTRPRTEGTGDVSRLLTGVQSPTMDTGSPIRSPYDGEIPSPLTQDSNLATPVSPPPQSPSSDEVGRVYTNPIRRFDNERGAPDGQERFTPPQMPFIPSQDGIRVAPWIENPPAQRYQVQFTDDALARLNELIGDRAAAFKSNIETLLSEDPRSNYVRNRYPDHEYSCVLEDMSISCVFNAASSVCTIVAVRNAEDMQQQN
ncbi:unnamed protein product [Plutella xylostella]|uniref:(diamondback moth) hypothetical protein n=1 Tax=Plutella xylostella TaxID=51655 RepID=A0A8S4F1U7_PLUXY|nr:unnamed protein product [Plutella xylostella]